MGAAPHHTALQPFVLPPQRIQELLQERQCTLIELLQQLVPAASAMARPGTSRFHVGAVGLGVSGSVYMGCNVELPKLPLSASIHAEQFLLTNMRHRGEDAVHNIVVSAAPCGHCRQFITEVGCSHDIKITYGDPPASYSLDELLLHRFGPEDLLGSNPPPLMLQPQNNPVAFAPSTRKWMESQPPALVRAAESCLECAANAYSPYTHSPSAAALVTASGDVYCGGYVESAAYNPSLPPLQAALVEAVIGGVGDYNEITTVLLMELPGAPVQHGAITRATVAAIAPGATLVQLDLDKTA